MAKNIKKMHFSERNLALNPPDYIINSKITGAPIKYKWNNDIGMRYIEGASARLFKAMYPVSYKFRMALGVALAEMIVWRFEGHTDLIDALKRIEAAWATIIDPLYAKDLRFNMTPAVHERADIVKAPLEMALYFLGKASIRYRDKSIYIAGAVINQAILARHLMPDKKTFDNWLADSITSGGAAFPRSANYDESRETYDASSENSIPRNFFDPAFKYTKVVAEEAVREFLQSLDPKKNPYLSSREEMIADGFKGEPYRS